jgi:hypothetical protein
MKPTRRAAIGLLLLSALLSATGCNQKRLVTRTEVVEVPHRQYVPLPPELTTPPTAPSAECVQNGKPVRCNGQLREHLAAMEAWGDDLVDQLRRIVDLQAEAIRRAAPPRAP